MGHKRDRNKGNGGRHLSVAGAVPIVAAEVCFTVFRNAEPSLQSTVDIFTTMQLLITALSMATDRTTEQFQAQVQQADPKEPLKKREFLGPREAPKVYGEEEEKP